MRTSGKIAIAALLLGAAPVVPNTLTYSMGYQYYTATDVFVEPATATSSEKVVTPVRKFKDDDNNGVVSVAVFKDTFGNLEEKQIPDQQYDKMIKRGGAAFNPSSELRGASLLSIITPKVQAAIARDTSGFASATADSVTIAYTNAGNAMVFFCMHRTGNYSLPATFNGVSATQVGTSTSGGTATWKLESFILASPTVGTQNAVCSMNAASNKLHGIRVETATGAGSCPLDGHDEATGNNGTSLSSSVTTATTGSWVVAVGLNVEGWSSVAGTGVVSLVSSDSTFVSALFDSNGTVAVGANSYGFSGGISGDQALIAVAVGLANCAAAVSPKIPNLPMLW